MKNLEMGLNKKWLYLAAFLLPVFVVLILCVAKEVYPFGERCILHIDMYHQYEPFFTELRDKLRSGEDLMYSFRIGLGTDFVALAAYYLASPLNLLLVFCPAGFVIEFMTILIILKTGISGLCFAIYLREHYKKNDITIIVFALFYALSGFMAAYNWNIMWLDSVMLTPLIVLGLEKLVKERKCGLYCISLGTAIFCNFYIAIMICIFLVLYYGILFLEELDTAKERLLSIGRFTLYSILAGGMGAVLIIPEALALGYTGSSNRSFPDTVEWYFSLVEMLARHCATVEVHTSREHWPNIYCGSAIFLLFFLYLLNRRISWKKKIKRLILVGLFWLGFCNNMADFLWHGMDFPDSLPARQSFLYVLVLLMLAYETYANRKGIKIWDVGIALLLSMGFLFWASKVTDAGVVTPSAIMLTAFLIGCYGVLFGVYLICKQEVRLMARVMILVLAVVEVFVNFDTTSLDTTSRTSYTKDWESVQRLLAEVDAVEEERFYRMEEMERLTKNDAPIYGYSSSTVFSTIMNLGVSDFYKKLGMEGGKNFYSYSGSNALTSALLSVKYMISDNPYEESTLRKLVAEDGQNYIYKNRYSLPIGFMVDASVEENWNPEKSMPISNLNSLTQLLGSDEALLMPLNGGVTVKEDETVIKVLQDAYVYATYSDKSVTNITITNGDRERSFNKCNHGYILDLGWCKAGDKIKITNSSDVENLYVQPYALSFEALDKAYMNLNRQTFEMTEFSDTYIAGRISVDDAGDLVFSIPQERGWSVFVNGMEVESEEWMGCFIKVPLTEGEYVVELRYQTPGFAAGAAVSAGSLLVFVAICLWKRRRERMFYL